MKRSTVVREPLWEGDKGIISLYHVPYLLGLNPTGEGAGEPSVLSSASGSSPDVGVLGRISC
jgi:hypothetical protein